MQIVNQKEENVIQEELLEMLTHVIKEILWLKVKLELNGYVGESRGNKFDDITGELKKAYKDVKEDIE